MNLTKAGAFLLMAYLSANLVAQPALAEQSLLNSEQKAVQIVIDQSAPEILRPISDRLSFAVAPVSEAGPAFNSHERFATPSSIDLYSVGFRISF